MGFSPMQRPAITKAIIELTDPSESLIIVESRPRRNNRFEDNMRMTDMMFRVIIIVLYMELQKLET